MRLIGSNTNSTMRLLNHWMASILRADRYSVYVCTTEWRITTETEGKNRRCKHTFLEIEDVPGTEELQAKLIVDFDFKEQFRQIKSTKKEKLLDYLPGVFIGTQEKLKLIIECFCCLAVPSPSVPKTMVYLQNIWLSPNRSCFPRPDINESCI